MVYNGAWNSIGSTIQAVYEISKMFSFPRYGLCAATSYMWYAKFIKRLSLWNQFLYRPWCKNTGFFFKSWWSSTWVNQFFKLLTETSILVFFVNFEHSSNTFWSIQSNWVTVVTLPSLGLISPAAAPQTLSHLLLLQGSVVNNFGFLSTTEIWTCNFPSCHCWALEQGS